MNIVVDGRQMKQCDSNTIHQFGVPSLVLMERAALGVVEVIQAQAEPESRVLVVCGTGNNGGDGVAIGRILWQRGYDLTLVMPGDWQKASEETARQMEICRAYGIELQKEIPQGQFDVVVDALFGIGLSRELTGRYGEIVEKMNRLEGWKVAVDIPSGIHADTGAVMGIGFRADVTVTFAFPKTGLLLYPGAEYGGIIKVKEIGIGRESFLEERPAVYELVREDLVQIPGRREYSNKGTYGKVLTVAGHKNMAGAAFLSGKASYATGAGMVKIFTEEANRTIIQQLLPEAILETYVPMAEPEEKTSEMGGEGTETAQGTVQLTEELSAGMNWADVIVAGPGLGTTPAAEKMIRTILAEAQVPVILDADGLNLTAQHMEWLRQRKAPLIVTPHLGEMARLVKKSIFDIQKQLLQVARQFARDYNVICVLKDARTVTALPDGRTFINTSGNNGMAAAGSGDVLTGILAGLIAQGMEPGEAAALGAYLHGAGADRMKEETGTYGMMAQDIIEGVRQVIKEADRKGN